VLLPSSDNTGAFHFEAAFVRFDNLFSNRWVNFKVGKFELDNLISEKRFLFLSGNGGAYQGYHFLPAGDVNDFGLGDNQIGAELSGHSENSYTRYGIALLSSTDGEVNLPTNQGYDAVLTLSHAVAAGAGDLRPGTAANVSLPPGARDARCNSGFVEAHSYVNPQLVPTGRWETVRMSQQADPTLPSDLGNIDAYSGGIRWYPIMFSRAGLSWHTEVSAVRTRGSAFAATDNVWTTSLFSGLDFDF